MGQSSLEVGDFLSIVLVVMAEQGFPVGQVAFVQHSPPFGRPWRECEHHSLKAMKLKDGSNKDHFNIGSEKKGIAVTCTWSHGACNGPGTVRAVCALEIPLQDQQQQLETWGEVAASHTKCWLPWLTSRAPLRGWL